MHGSKSRSEESSPPAGFLKIQRAVRAKSSTPSRDFSASTRESRTFKSSSKFLFVNSPSAEHLTFKPEVDPISREIAARIQG